MAIRSKAPHLPKIENSISVLPDSGYTTRWVQWHKSESCRRGAGRGQRPALRAVVAPMPRSVGRQQRAECEFVRPVKPGFSAACADRKRDKKLLTAAPPARDRPRTHSRSPTLELEHPIPYGFLRWLRWLLTLLPKGVRSSGSYTSQRFRPVTCNMNVLWSSQCLGNPLSL
jgi:hypothetical protein